MKLNTATAPSFLTLLLLIAFASANAVLFTPALPSITEFFHVSTSAGQQTITWFLIGYAVGQLLYGPLASRFGRKWALYAGIYLQIFSSLICVFAGTVHVFGILIIGRFLLALGSGVGLKMTFTIINEYYEPKAASEKVSYLMLAFAVTPSLAVTLGGLLTLHYGWTSCFYAGAVYGLLLLLAVARLPNAATPLNRNALQMQHLIHSYASQFKNIPLITGGLLMGCTTSFVYVFAASAPFIAMNLLGMNSAEYGFANMLPPIGLITGSLVSAQLIKSYSLLTLIRIGIILSSLGAGLMLLAMLFHLSALLSLFLPMIVLYLGLCFILPNASSIAMSSTDDKAHGSAVMNFINMGLTTVVVLMLGFFPMTSFLLPLFALTICVVMLGLFNIIVRFGFADKIA